MEDAGKEIVNRCNSYSLRNIQRKESTLGTYSLLPVAYGIKSAGCSLKLSLI